MPFAKIDGKELHYTDYAPSSDPREALNIVFVHGLGSTQNYYAPILPYLTHHRCITFDNYGAGRSKYYSELYPDISIEQLAESVLGLMDHLKVEKAVVVGYSMGGMVPTTIAASKKGAGRIISGVCIGPVHPSPQVAEVFVQRVKTVTEGKSASHSLDHSRFPFNRSRRARLTLILPGRWHRNNGEHDPLRSNRASHKSASKILHSRNDHVARSGRILRKL